MYKILLLLVLPLCLQAQSYQYTLEIKHLKGPTTVQFGYWGLGTPYLLDSVVVDTLRPVATFKGNKALDAGLYFFNFSTVNAPMEFIINGENDLVFKTAYEAPVDSFTVVSSKENTPYFYWRTFKLSREKRINEYRATFDMLRRATRDKDVLEEHARNIRQLRLDIDEFTRKQTEKYPDLFFSKLVVADLPTEVPTAITPVGADGQPNPAYMQYFRSHFWDNYDFKDTRLLRSPALARKTDDWLQIQPANLDSVKVNLTAAIGIAAVQPKSRQALIQLLLERFDRPSYGGNEAMLTYLFDQHMPSATAVGMDTATWMRVEYKATTYRATLPGRLAPNIILPDTTGQDVALYDVKANYTLLYFFSPLCSHCKQMTPKIYEMTLPYLDKGIAVYAVTTDGELEHWKKYVSTTTPRWTCVADANSPSPVERMYATHALPNLLLLGPSKEILVRRLPLEDLPQVLPSLVVEPEK